MIAHFNPSTHAAKAGVRTGGRRAMPSVGVRGLSASRGRIPAGIAAVQ